MNAEPSSVPGARSEVPVDGAGTAAVLPAEATPTRAGKRRVDARLSIWQRLAVRREMVLATQLVAFIAFIALWKLAIEHVAVFYIGDPARVWDTFAGWITSGEALEHARYTMTSAAVGFVLGSLVAVPLGLLLGLNRHLYDLLDPLLNAFYSLPKIAFAPLLVTWFGLGLTPKIFLAALVVVFLMFNATLAGTREIDHELIEQVQLMGADRRIVLQKVVIPTVGLHVVHGLRMSFPYAIHGAIIGELIATQAGLGFLLQRARGTYNTSEMIAALLLVMVFAVIVVKIIDFSGRFVPDAK